MYLHKCLQSDLYVFNHERNVEKYRFLSTCSNCIVYVYALKCNRLAHTWNAIIRYDNTIYTTSMRNSQFRRPYLIQNSSYLLSPPQMYRLKMKIYSQKKKKFIKLENINGLKYFSTSV